MALFVVLFLAQAVPSLLAVRDEDDEKVDNLSARVEIIPSDEALAAFSSAQADSIKYEAKMIVAMIAAQSAVIEARAMKEEMQSAEEKRNKKNAEYLAALKAYKDAEAAADLAVEQAWKKKEDAEKEASKALEGADDSLKDVNKQLEWWRRSLRTLEHGQMINGNKMGEGAYDLIKVEEEKIAEANRRILSMRRDIAKKEGMVAMYLEKQKAAVQRQKEEKTRRNQTFDEAANAYDDAEEAAESDLSDLKKRMDLAEAAFATARTSAAGTDAGFENAINIARKAAKEAEAQIAKWEKAAFFKEDAQNFQTKVDKLYGDLTKSELADRHFWNALQPPTDTPFENFIVQQSDKARRKTLKSRCRGSYKDDPSNPGMSIRSVTDEQFKATADTLRSMRAGAESLAEIFTRSFTNPVLFQLLTEEDNGFQRIQQFNTAWAEINAVYTTYVNPLCKWYAICVMGEESAGPDACDVAQAHGAFGR